MWSSPPDLSLEVVPLITSMRVPGRAPRRLGIYSGVSTITFRRCSMASSGSSAKPVCTGEGCTTVLRGAMSHPKRWP